MHYTNGVKKTTANGVDPYDHQEYPLFFGTCSGDENTRIIRHIAYTTMKADHAVPRAQV